MTHEDIAAALKESVVERVTPLAHMSYPDQLIHKHTWLKGVYESFTQAFEKDIKSGQEINPIWYQQNPIIPLDSQVIHSEKIDGYRNKVEFTIGYKYDIEK